MTDDHAASSGQGASREEGSDGSGLLAGVRVIESSLLGPGHLGTFLADLGAEVIKVESPAGDYIRQMTWPIVEGVSLMHLHTHRGKRSVTLDLKNPTPAASCTSTWRPPPTWSWRPCARAPWPASGSATTC